MLWPRAAHSACALVLGAACSAEPGVSTLAVPPPDGFAPVSAALANSCGSLDCHGRAGQNLRLYGAFGLRLDPEDVPDGDETPSGSTGLVGELRIRRYLPLFIVVVDVLHLVPIAWTNN